MNRLTPVAALVLIASFTGETYASEFLKSLEGSWRGSGEIRQFGTNKPTERTVCKITSEYSEKTGELKTKGRCGTVSGSGRINGRLQQSPDSKIVVGNFIGRDASKNLKGTLSGQQVTLRGPGPKNTAQQLNLALKGKNQLSIQLEIKGSDPVKNGFSNISLKRQ